VWVPGRVCWEVQSLRHVVSAGAGRVSGLGGEGDALASAVVGAQAVHGGGESGAGGAEKAKGGRWRVERAGVMARRPSHGLGVAPRSFPIANHGRISDFPSGGVH
jgi:hypothetical protein